MKVIERVKEVVNDENAEWKELQPCGGRKKVGDSICQDMLCYNCYSMIRIEQSDMLDETFLSTLTNDEFCCPFCGQKISNKIVKCYIVYNKWGFELTQGEKNILDSVPYDENVCQNYSLRNRF